MLLNRLLSSEKMFYLTWVLVVNLTQMVGNLSGEGSDYTTLLQLYLGECAWIVTSLSKKFWDTSSPISNEACM